MSIPVLLLGAREVRVSEAAVFLAGLGVGALGAALLAGARARRERRRRGADGLLALAHDLRTPLSSISAYAEILQDADEEDPAERARFLGIIHEETRRMERLVDERLGSTTAPPDPPPATAASAPSGRTVLVVDDDQFIVEATRALLSRAGFHALAASGGEEALRQARSARPDLILMDLTMPAMPGDEALRRLRSDPTTKNIPVIITTGDDGPPPEGAAAVLMKPISREALLAAVARAIPRGV